MRYKRVRGDTTAVSAGGDEYPVDEAGTIEVPDHKMADCDAGLRDHGFEPAATSDWRPAEAAVSEDAAEVPDGDGKNGSKKGKK